MPRYAYGGQALIEGVLMRGRDAIAVALRHPDGRIVYATEKLDSGVHGHPAAKWPFVRGLIVLYETLVVGTRWLIRSANVQGEEEDMQLGKGSVIVMLVVMLGVAIAVFTLLPLFISTVATSGSDQGWAQPVVEGLIQVGIFLGYLTLISRAPDIHRVFQYHGAEHMTIHALEAGDPLTVEEVRKYPTAHHRCGTEFLVILVMLSIFTFSLVGKQPPLIMIASRIVLIPVLAAVGYEVLKFGARYRTNPIMKVIMYPGILVQKITTKQPTDDMIEVAIVSMEQALEADGEPIPEGSSLFDRAPMALGPTTEAGVSDLDCQARRGRRAVRRGPGGARQPRGPAGPVADPAAGPGALPAGAGRRGVPAARSHPGRAGRRPRDARHRRGRRRAEGDGPRGDRAAWRPTRRASSRSSRSSSCRATRTTTATSSSRSGPGRAATRRPCSRPSSTGCTSATPSATATRPSS